MNISKYLTLSMAVALAAAATGCKDDHFEVNADVAAQQTLWENISTRPEISDFASILKKLPYSKSEGKFTSETYADILNGTQTFTVWAPINGSYDSKYYLSLLETDDTDSISKVEQQLVRNCMTRFAYIYNQTDSVKINLYNNKSTWINYNKQTLQGKKLKDSNIASSNGVLHTLDTSLSYLPNLYELMSMRHGTLDSINAFIKSYERLDFNETQSIKGPTVNGQVTYVDSVTTINNDYESYFTRSHISREDSNYVMILPTDRLWTELVEQNKTFFHYMPTYNETIYKLSTDGKDSEIPGSTVEFSQFQLDSITNLFTKNAICQNLIFNANWQPGQIPVTSIADLQKADQRGDSLISTSGMKFKKTGTLNSTNKTKTVEVDSYASLFGSKDPVETSNGYAYIVDQWNMPFNASMPNMYLDAYQNHLYSNTTVKPQEGSLVVSYNKVFDEQTLDTVSQRQYRCYRMEPATSNSNPGTRFMLPDVLSGHYDIFIVIAYNFSKDAINKFNATVVFDSITTSKKRPEKALKPLNGSKNFTNHRAQITDDGKAWMSSTLTDTIQLAENFYFPVSYYGLGNIYPNLLIESKVTSTEAKNGYCRDIWVNAIILKPKDEAALQNSQTPNN